MALNGGQYATGAALVLHQTPPQPRAGAELQPLHPGRRPAAAWPGGGTPQHLIQGPLQIE
jgi:hypothetical protein